ncbi:WD repeat-containing protein 49-like [Corticium candelabrum]|uniref:WD repeat-containing protein 49-like n=1 Tax=Corticium candelabrum TaxID=121492 RepID=UPI002E25E0CB|nr:WD repeat-containing protein 49-like [Corticium candelabrum]XP_062512025.1 WD repeat-containing protein 49-like [Corticium candelabrum]
MLMCYNEKEDKVKATQVPQWKPVRVIQNRHKKEIQGVELFRSPQRYVTVSKDGCLSTWKLNMQMKDLIRIQREHIDRRDLWVTSFSVMPQLNRLIIALTTKEILIYDITALPECTCQVSIGGFTTTPISLCSWSTDEDVSESGIVVGDSEGNVSAIIVSDSAENFFPVKFAKLGKQISTSSHDDDTLVSLPTISVSDIKAGKYKDIRVVTHSEHKGWVRKVKYYASLDAVISCATSDRNSIVLAYIEKATNLMRTINFSVKQGINDFDYSRSVNLIVSAGVDRMIRLWNPYVTSKPVGIMEGHTSPVVAILICSSRGQIFSLCAQKVLRVWDIKLQACLQVMSGIFPRGPPVATNMVFEEEHSRLFASFNNQLCLAEIRHDAKNRVVTHEKSVVCVVYSSRYNQVLTAGADSVIAAWILDTGQRVWKIFHAHGEAEITCISVTSNQLRFVTGGTDGLIKIWDMNNGTLRNTLLAADGLSVDITDLVIVEQGVVAVGWARVPAFLQTEDLTNSESISSEWTAGREHRNDITCVAFSSPHHIATASLDGEVILWNIYSQEMDIQLNTQLKTKPSGVGRRSPPKPRRSSSKMQGCSLSSKVEAQERPLSVNRLVFLDRRISRRSAAQLVGCGSQGWVRFWSIYSGQCMAEFISFPGVTAIVALATDASNTVLATGSPNGDMSLWRIKSYCTRNTENIPPVCICAWIAHLDAVTSILLVNRGSSLFVVTASTDCCCCVWDTSGTQIGVFGQDNHWKLQSTSRLAKEENPESTSFVSTSQSDLHRKGQYEVFSKSKLPPIDEIPSSSVTQLKGEVDEIDNESPPAVENNLSVFAASDYKTRNVVNSSSADNGVKSVSVWDATSLGISYEIARKSKRPRQQLVSLPRFRLGSSLDHEDYQPEHPIVLGPEASPYQRLPFIEIHDPGVALKKPALLDNFDYYFGSPDRKSQKSISFLKKPKVTPHAGWKALQAKFDEMTLFPKNFWDSDVRNRYRLKSHRSTGRSRQKTHVTFVKPAGSSRSSTQYKTQLD